MATKYYAQRMERAKQFLGGKCVSCGATERLEFDHIDRSTKSFIIASHISRSLESLKAELEKCQLLCHTCHMDKTVKERHHTRITDKPHGTTNAYFNYGCRCGECTKVASASSVLRLRAWRKKRREALESAKSSV